MSITKAKGKLGEMEVIDGVTFNFINLRIPVNKFESDKKEYNVSCTISEDDFDEIEERKYKVSTETVKNDKYESRFKVPAPYPDQRKQCVVRFGCSNLRKDKKTGEFVEVDYELELRPKVFHVVDGKEVDITDKMLSNGCKGRVFYQTHINSFGTMCYLRKIFLDEVIEYTKPEEVE